MSQLKSVRSKRKILIPNEISVSLKSPKSRKFLFPNGTTPNYPKESEFEGETVLKKKCKRKKLRNTQNFLVETNSEVYTRVSDSLKEKKIANSPESVDIESYEVFLESEERPKTTTKCRKNKMKLPSVLIDDLEYLDDHADYEEILSNKKKHRSIESISSSTSEARNAGNSGIKLKRRKGSKKCNPEYNKESTPPKTRSLRKTQKRETTSESNRSPTSGSELNVQTGGSAENTETSEVDDGIISTDWPFSSVHEGNGITAEGAVTETKRKKKSKVSNPKYEELETVVFKTRSSKKRNKYLEMDDVNEGNQERKGSQTAYSELTNTTRKSGKNNEYYEVDEKIVVSNEGFSSFASDEERSSQTFKKKKNRSKLSNQIHDENETIKPSTRSSRKRQKDKAIIDIAKENITKKIYSSVDEDDETEPATSRSRRKRSKKLCQEKDVGTLTLKSRNSKKQKHKVVNTSSNDEMGDSEENNKVNVNESSIETYYSAIDEDDGIKAETSGGRRKRSKKSKKTREEKQTVTRKNGSSKEENVSVIENKSHEIMKINWSKNQREDSEESIEINEDVLIINKGRSSFDLVHDTMGKRRSRISGNVQKKKLSQNIEIVKDRELEDSLKESKGEDLNLTRDSKKSTDQSPKSEENTDDSDEGIFTKVPFSSADDDDIILETSGRKRKRSKNSDLDCEVEQMKSPKTRISEISPERNILAKTFEMENDDKENVITENEPMIEHSNISRRSQGTLSVRSPNQIAEPDKIHGTNEKTVYTDKSFGVADKDDQLLIDSNRMIPEPAILGRNTSRARKRWTIVVDKQDLIPNLEVNAETEIERFSTSLSVNLDKRRSVRKRWSTELRKKFESIKEGNEPVIATCGVSKENSLSEGHIGVASGTSSLNTTTDYPVSTKNFNHVDSPMPLNFSAGYNSIEEKQNETYTPEKSKNQTQDLSFRNSKRLSRSLDLSDGISLLQETITLENESDARFQDDQGSFVHRKSQTPGSILKRRGTYDLDDSVTDVSVLKSLSESNLTDSRLLFKQDGLENVKKNVRFQHVAVRRGCGRKNHLNTPENKSESNNLQVKSEKKLAPKLTATKKSVSFDQTMFSASSLASSTPLHSLRKKQTLKTENLSVVNSNRRSRSVETKRDKYVSRIRMPNFTKIHQKAMDRVEDIREMTKRKAERARLLLSGQRPTSSKNTTQDKTNQTSKPKQLKFNTCQLSTHSTKAGTSGSIAEETGQAKIDSLKSNIKNVRNQPDGSNKNTNPTKNIEIASSKPMLPDTLRNVKINPTQLDVVRRVEQIKTIATKSKPQSDTREERRNILKGVRGNRRFELLMKMRKK